MDLVKPFLLALLILAPLPALTQDGLSRQLPCGSWSRDVQPAEWGWVMRDCAALGRYAEALSAFYAYNSYILFDQQRVRDESAHVVKDELNTWVVTGLSRAEIAALKPLFEQMRNRAGPVYEATCLALQRLGPPDYRPDYMIRRGMIPRKSEDDWQQAGFDAAAAWHRARVEINGCPSARTD